MVPEQNLSSSQKAATGTYPKAAKTSPQPSHAVLYHSLTYVHARHVIFKLSYSNFTLLQGTLKVIYNLKGL